MFAPGFNHALPCCHRPQCGEKLLCISGVKVEVVVVVWVIFGLILSMEMVMAMAMAGVRAYDDNAHDAAVR